MLEQFPAPMKGKVLGANCPHRPLGIRMLPAIRAVHTFGLCFVAPTPSVQPNSGIPPVKCLVLLLSARKNSQSK